MKGSGCLWLEEDVFEGIGGGGEGSGVLHCGHEAFERWRWSCFNGLKFGQTR